VTGSRIPGLRIEVVYLDEHLLELEVVVDSARFRGTAKVYASHGVFVDLAHELSGFPARGGDRREVLLGAPDRTFAGGTVRLGLAADARGRVRVDASLREAGPPEQNASLQLELEPAALDRLVATLRQTIPAEGVVVQVPAAGAASTEKRETR